MVRVLACAIAAALLVPAAASGATFPVTSTGDGIDDDTTDNVCTSAAVAGKCTLRAAIQQANATSGPDVVSLPASSVPYSLTVGPAGDDAAASGDLDVTEKLTLTGDTPGTTTIDGANLDRVLDVRAGVSLDVAHLTIRRGKAPGEAGGAIRGLGTHLGLNDVLVEQNDGLNVIAQDGPATANLGLTRTSITSNTGATSIVEAQGPSAMTDTVIDSNTVDGASGFPAIVVLDAASSSDITATLTRTVVSGNTITNSGEGVMDFDPSLRGPLASHLTITDSAFRDNQAPQGAIGILVDPCGQGTSPTDVTVRRTVFARNKAAFNAGGIEWAPCGGNGAPQTLDIADSLFTGNAGGPFGGAIAFRGPAESVLTLTGSTLVGNTASDSGGALYTSTGAATVVNSTFSANRTTSGSGEGGGAVTLDGGTLALRHVTIAQNSVPGSATGGGILNNVNQSSLTVTGSILAGNTDAAGASACAGASPTSGGSNLESAATCALGGLQNVDPLLAALAANGGATPTRAIAATSPAVDAAAAGSCPATDQRGVARPQGAGCDIGAFELVPAAQQQPPPPGVTPPALEPGPSVPSLGGPLGGPLPPPVLGETVNLHPVSGQVLIALPAGRARAAVPKGLTFVPLTQDRQIPVGAFLDTRRGVVQLTSATGTGPATQAGKFDGGLFQVGQARAARAVTDLRLRSARTVRCAAIGKRARAARRKRVSDRVVSRLRGDAKGRFRTSGRYAAATVRGTRWSMTDRCDGTLTRVTRGVVVVRDLRRHKTIRVRAGKSYFARAPR